MKLGLQDPSLCGLHLAKLRSFLINSGAPSKGNRAAFDIPEMAHELQHFMEYVQ
jgi:hypothetical protein